jgi:type IV pilus assembly protein PilW
MKHLASKKAHERGLSMVELLVSLAIGSLLIVGAVFVYSQSRTSSTVSDTVARLQENARFIMSVMEPDVQLAGAFGYDNYPTDIVYAGAADTSIAKMRQDDVKFTAAPAAAHACGKNFALDLVATVQGLENEYTLDCAAFGTGAAPGTDVLIVRRASPTPQPANAAILQLYTNRVTPPQKLFSGAVPGPIDPGMLDVRDLIVNVYYVSVDSDQRQNFPSLRRKWLGLDAGGNYVMNDEEIMSGVEDLQVQFGVDMGADMDGDGAVDDVDGNNVADSTNGQSTRYVNADAAGKADMAFGAVASVRMWVRVRADQGEVGFSNTTRYQYATTDFQAADNIRRLVASRTFYLRNSRIYRD